MARSHIAALLLAGASLFAGVETSFAQPCTREEFAKIVNESGAALRRLSAETQPRMQTGFRRLKEKNGWREEDYVDKANALIMDERAETLDQRATELLARLDRLAEDASPDNCARLTELQATALELQATVRAKTEHMLARLEAAAADTPVAPAKPQPKPLPGSQPATPKKSTGDAVAAKPPEKAVPTEKAPERPPGKEKEWGSTTTHNPTSSETAIRMEPLPDASTTSRMPPPPMDPAEDGYSIDEIRSASRGFFGNVSTGLASVIEHAFAKSGRPSAYVLGNEGGGALIAGVRYGKGTLYLRNGGTREVYWHGPSIGYDLGAAGSKTMFLIYRLRDPEKIFSGFTGVDGSAYVVGGVGLQFVTDGKVLMAPIRSGLGLRIGASIGYIRFTPQPTWNPF
jgi:ribosomal protein L17